MRLVQFVDRDKSRKVAVVSDDGKREFCIKHGAVGVINRNHFAHWGRMPDTADAKAYGEWAKGARAFGKAIWDPIDLTSRMTGIGVGVALVILTLDTMCCNLAANLVGPAYDFSSLWPKGISYRTGGLITATIAIVMMPWKILATTQGYIFTWLVGYSALLGPVAGILMVDYFFIRGTRLDSRELFDESGEYSYTGGWNIAAVVALAIGVLPNLPGFLHTAFPAVFPNVPAFFNTLYTYAWFVGLALASTVYGTWMKLRRSPGASMASA